MNEYNWQKAYLLTVSDMLQIITSKIIRIIGVLYIRVLWDGALNCKKYWTLTSVIVKKVTVLDYQVDYLCKRKKLLFRQTGRGQFKFLNKNHYDFDIFNCIFSKDKRMRSKLWKNNDREQVSWRYSSDFITSNKLELLRI